MVPLAGCEWRRRRPRLPAVCVCVTLALLACGPAPASGQYPQGGGLFNQDLAAQKANLDFVLQNSPDLENIFYPDKYLIPTDFYDQQTTTDYLMNVIFDPCRNQAYNCCADTYGTPEWRSINSVNTSIDFGQDILYSDTGAVINVDTSRRPEDVVVLDESCTGVFTPDPHCLVARVRRTDYPTMPACWNHNETIVAGVPCRAPADGSPIGMCLELGFTQTAWIVECGGAFKNNPHCGTFLEIHRPGDNTTLAAAKLRGQLTSGYRMTVISTTFQGNSSRLLCKGDHELWWVMRTRYNWIVQRKMPFRIVSPVCDWDQLNNRFQIYATAATAQYDFNLDPYNQTNFLFSQLQDAGILGYPAKGMGGTLILPTANNTLPTGGGQLPGINEPDYVPPARPTTQQFQAEYPDIPLNDKGLPIIQT